MLPYCVGVITILAKKIRQILIDREIKIDTFSAMLNVSQPNFSQKLRRDNFRESELYEMAELLDCDVEITLRDRKTGKCY